MKQKFKIIAVLVIVMLLLAGCGDGEKTSSSKNVEDFPISINWGFGNSDEEVEISGKYTGSLVNGKAEGEGTFIADSENQFEYVGSFAKGTFNGKGTITAQITEGEEATVLTGTFTEGTFTPTTGELYNLVGSLSYFGEFTVSDEVIDYIDSHTDLFPLGDDLAVQSDGLKDFNAKQFAKTREQEEIGLVGIYMYAVQAYEDSMDPLTDKLTSILGVDDEGNYYSVYYLGSTFVCEGDNFTTYAVPCATTSFENVGGGNTNVIVLLASVIK